MATLYIFLGICGLAAALTGLLWVTTGQYRQYREQKQLDREHAVQQRLRAIKLETDRLERDLGIRDEHKNLLHPKPRKRLAYHPNGYLLDADEAERIAAVQAVVDAQRDYCGLHGPINTGQRKSGLIRLPSNSVVHHVIDLRHVGYTLVLRDEHGPYCRNGRVVSEWHEPVLRVFDPNGHEAFALIISDLSGDEQTVIQRLCHRPSSGGDA